MGRVITTSMYRYNDVQVRIINGSSVTQKKATQKFGIINSGLTETFMDYWFFDYGGYHGSNPNGLGQTDTAYTVGSNPANVFGYWASTGSPLLKNYSVVCDNSNTNNDYEYVDFIFTLKPMLWNDIYGKVGEKILFNIINLPYHRDNPLYLEYPSVPSFVGNQKIIPNAKGLLTEYYSNLFKLTADKDFTYTIGDEYAVNAGTSTPETMAQTATSKRLRNKITIDGGTSDDDKNLFYGIMYGIMPISVVINPHN